MAALEQRVRERLTAVIDPCSAAQGYDLDIVEMGLLAGVTVEDGHVTVSLRLTSPSCMMVDRFVTQLDEAVGSLPGVQSVRLETDDGLEWHPGMMADPVRERRSSALSGLEE